MENQLKFKRGDVVRHRASLESAVVEHHCVSCVKHSGYQCLSSDHISGKTCKYEFNGSYSLSPGFGQESVIVSEDMMIMDGE